MKQEIVDKVIERVSGGNDNMRQVARSVYEVVSSDISRWPDSQVCQRKLLTKVVEGVGVLVGQRIRSNDVLEEGYWHSEKGREVNRSLSNFIEVRGK